VTSPEEQRRRPHPQRGGAVERKAKSQEPGDEVAVPMPENGPPPPVSRFPSRDSDSRARYPSRTEFYSLLPGLRCGPVVEDAIALRLTQASLTPSALRSYGPPQGFA